jgi:predicted Fe-Mo cluster-binding NifX family protein
VKIALITDDGKTISQHFGRATHYLVVTIEDSQVKDRILAPKMGHGQFHGEQHNEEHHPGGQHGFDDASHQKHSSMAEPILGCEALICGGMGMGAYESMRRLGIKPVVTDISDIDAAIQAYLDGKLVDRVDLLH